MEVEEKEEAKEGEEKTGNGWAWRRCYPLERRRMVFHLLPFPPLRPILRFPPATCFLRIRQIAASCVAQSALTEHRRQTKIRAHGFANAHRSDVRPLPHPRETRRRRN